jgi:hypothetical protein
MSLCSDTVFVVTRGGRRVEAQNYLSYEDAKIRASALITMINEWDKPCPTNEVKIVKTRSPYKIR